MLSDRVEPKGGNDAANEEKTTMAQGQCPQSSRYKLLFRCLATLGLMNVCFVLGAAVIFFELPCSTFLRQAFLGGAAFFEAKKASQQLPPEQRPLKAAGQVDKPDKTCDGFTLCMYGAGSRAVLVNMLGNVIHQWQAPYSRIWPDPPHVHGPINDAGIYFNDGHVYPNGDLLAVIEGPIDVRNSSNGFGLVKLDKDSHILWKYAEKCHHDVDVGDDGIIYAITNEIVTKAPIGLENIPTPYMVDVVHVISAEGQTIKKIPLLEAFKDSPFAPLLGVLDNPRNFSGAAPHRNIGARPFFEDERSRDVLHANAVKVLNRALATKFPMFKPGQILISPRHLDAVAVLDPDSGKVVWASRGPWRAQHDPSFLDNGHILLFDNLGSPAGSRVLEYDPATTAFPWEYPGEKGKPFFSRIRGMCQRLPNGNTLIVSSDEGEAFEVTPGREIVWSCSTGGIEFNRARRYTPEQLPFLKGVQLARP